MSKESKKLIIDTIRHKDAAKVPTMYRAEPSTNQKLIEFFGLGDIEDDWERLLELIGADNYSDGETLGGFTTYSPKYIGPSFEGLFEINRFDIWGIKAEEVYIGKERHIVFSQNPPLRDADEISDIEAYRFPSLDWFDFSVYKNNTEQVAHDSQDDQREVKLSDLKPSEEYFLNTSFQNSLFMVSTFLRGFEKFLMDLITDQAYAEALLEKIGDFMLEFCKKNLKSIGEVIDMYGMWDDFADQDGLLISPEFWRKFYRPWYKKMIDEAKRYDLLVCFHVCGNCSEIIGDLIGMGVDMLDPVQVSARDMDLKSLKKRFGKNICFHGGLDSQKFLPFASPEEITQKVHEIKKMFRGDGGLILGPSHYITSDVPIENILAIYKH